MISLSASGKSNGERFDSASADTMKITKARENPTAVETRASAGGSRNFQPACASTMPVVERRAGEHCDRHPTRGEQRQFIADQLRQRAHGCEQVSICSGSPQPAMKMASSVAAPAAKKYSTRGVQIDGDERATERNYRERQDRKREQ